MVACGWLDAPQLVQTNARVAILLCPLKVFFLHANLKQ